MTKPTPHLTLAKLNKDTKELVELINHYNQEPTQLDKIIQLTSIIINQNNIQQALHTVRDYIQDKEGNHATLFYKLFLDDFDFSNTLKNKINEKNTLKGNHDVEKSVHEKHMKESLHQALFSIKGNVKVNEEQTLFEYLFDHCEYTSIAELEMKSFLAKEYLDQLPEKKETVKSQTEYKEVMDKNVDCIIDNLQNVGLKNEILSTCQKLNNATTFDDIKQIMYAYLDNNNAALVPGSLTEGIAWFKPFMQALDLIVKHKHLHAHENENQNKEVFLKTLFASQSEILRYSYHHDCIEYLVGVNLKEDKLVFFNFIKNSDTLKGLTQMTDIELFQIKYAQNFILNEKQKLESSLVSDTIENQEANIKKTKI
jgi:hypothetical protein